MYIYNNGGEKALDFFAGLVIGILICLLPFTVFKTSGFLISIMIYLIVLAIFFGLGRKFLIIGLLLVLAVPFLVFGACLLIIAPMGLLRF